MWCKEKLMKKIVYIVSIVPHYNLHLFQKLSTYYESKGEEFYLITMKNPPKEGRAGVTGKIIDNHFFYDNESHFKIGKFTLYWQSDIFKLLKKIGPDTIVISGHIGNIVSWILPSLYKNKVCEWQTGYEFNSSKLKDFLQGIYLKRFQHHLAYHTAAKKFCLKYGIESEKVTVLHNTIDESELFNSTREESRIFLSEKYGISSDLKILLYVGALLEEKKLGLLIDMMTYLDETFMLVIVGDGRYKETLVQYSSEKKNVIFVGRQLEFKHYFFIGADILMMPGTGGLVLNEALYYGLPIMSGYGDGSADDLVIDNFNGKRIDGLNAKQLAVVVSKIYLGTKLEELRKNADTIFQKYTFKKYINNTIKALSL